MLQHYQIDIKDLFTKFSYNRLLGEGCFGKIYELVHQPTKQIYAVKKVYIDPKYHNRELDNFLALKNSPNVLQIEKFAEVNLDDLTIYLDEFSEKKGNDFITQERDSLWQVSRNYTKVLYILTKAFDDNLRNFILSRKMDKTTFKTVSLEILKGIDSMHRKGFAHRDLKPDNILINEKNLEVVIADLGSAKKIGKDTGGIAYICSRAYRAPELLMGSTVYGTRIDLWSLGCVIFEMMTKSTNRFFRGKDARAMLREILKVIGKFSNTDLKGMNITKKVTIESKIERVDVKGLLREGFGDEEVEFGLKLLRWNPKERKEAGELVESSYFRNI